MTDEERAKNRQLAEHVMGHLADLALNVEADETLSKYATLAVVRFSSAAELQPVLIASCAKVIENTFELASSEDPEIRPVMVTLLANLSTNHDNHVCVDETFTLCVNHIPSIASPSPL